MDYRRMQDTVFARIDRGEEIQEQLRVIAERESIRLASVSGLGAVNDFTVGVFKTDRKQYDSNTFTGYFEIVSLTGTITTMDGQYYAHLHITAGDAEGRAVGGHLNTAVVSATSEIVLHLIDGTVEREFSPEVGLNLLKF